MRKLKATTPRKIDTPADDFDGAWKFLLRRYFPLFLEFFWNQAFQEIDWKQEFVFLDNELRRVVKGRRGKKSLGIVDVLVKVWLLDGTEQFLLLHIEFQAQKDEILPERMFYYNVRASDLYRVSVLSMAILADPNPTWHPTHYTYGRWGSENRLDFHTYKLLDWVGREAALEAHANPFALAVLAHLITQATKGDAQRRYETRLELARLLQAKGWEERFVEDMWEFLGWLLVMPDRLEKRLLAEPTIQVLEKEEVMETMSPYHRKVAKRNLQIGEKIGIQIGEKIGIQIGKEEGQRQILVRLLTLRFGVLSEEVIAKVSALTESRINQILEQVLVVQTLEELSL